MKTTWSHRSVGKIVHLLVVSETEKYDLNKSPTFVSSPLSMKYNSGLTLVVNFKYCNKNIVNNSYGSYTVLWI